MPEVSSHVKTERSICFRAAEHCGGARATRVPHAGPARLVPLASLADGKAGVIVTALRAAAERGHLRAQKSDDGSWLSSKNWLADYKDNKHKRSAKTAKPSR